MAHHLVVKVRYEGGLQIAISFQGQSTYKSQKGRLSNMTGFLSEGKNVNKEIAQYGPLCWVVRLGAKMRENRIFASYSIIFVELKNWL